MRVGDNELAEDRAAELGYRESGAKELAMRDWWSLRGEAGEFAPTPRAFKKAVNVLRVKKWQKANPEKRRANANRYAMKPGVADRTALLSKRRRYGLHKKRPPIQCAECRVLFCPVKPKTGRFARRFCTDGCGASWQ